MLRYLTVLFFLLTCLASHVSAQSNFPAPKVAQKKSIPPVVVKEGVKEKNRDKDKGTKVVPVVKPEQPKEKPLEQLSNYDLQLKAGHDPQAQYLLGRRYIQRGDSVGEVIGINWLRQSAGNGNVKAKSFLRTYRKKW